MTLPRNLAEAKLLFARRNAVREFLISRRWPNGVACPQCGSKSIYPLSNADLWECKYRHRKRTFTLKTGTIFEDSALGLDKWLLTIWMVANTSELGSTELARNIGVTQKTAWLMLQRIKLALQEPESRTVPSQPAPLAPSRQATRPDK